MAARLRKLRDVCRDAFPFRAQGDAWRRGAEDPSSLVARVLALCQARQGGAP